MGSIEISSSNKHSGDSPIDSLSREPYVTPLFNFRFVSFMKMLLRRKYILGIFILALCFLGYGLVDLEGIDTFRTMQDPIPANPEVNLTGLRELKASGGQIPRFSDLQKKIPENLSKKVIFNLTNEAHGYINGVPTNFLGYHLPSPKLKHFPRRIFFTRTIQKLPELVITEKEEAQKYNFDYINISIGSKYTAPDEHIDQFVTFIDGLPKDTWVHFHCVQGKGRTSMALVMLDIMKNAPRVTLKDIVARHHLLGSVDLFDTQLWKKPKYTETQLKERKKFIENFYAFISQRKVEGIQTWSDWKRQRLQAYSLSLKSTLARN